MNDVTDHHSASEQAKPNGNRPMNRVASVESSPKTIAPISVFKTATDAAVQPASASVATNRAEARAFNFWYGQFQALKDINLPIVDLRVTALIGARGIARRVLALNGHMPATAAAQIGWLARRVRVQFGEALEAYRERDRAKAELVRLSDVDLDILYNDFFQHLLLEMQKDMANIVCCTHLMFVAKALERIGDHATNIAESVSFAISGTPVGQPRPKGPPGSA